MPGFDGTGPRGMGSMTGGGRGFCAVSLRSAWTSRAGMGFRMPYAVTRSMPYYGAPPFAPQMNRKEELDYLETLAQSMRDNLKEIEARIQEIDNKKE